MTEQELIDMVADANNPDAPAERLLLIFEAMIRGLAPYEHQTMLLAALARNPNTPPNHLEWLAMNYPEEVIDNPALPWLLIEDPTFPQSSVAAERMAKFSRCPEIIKRHARITREQHLESLRASLSLYDYRGRGYQS